MNFVMPDAERTPFDDPVPAVEPALPVIKTVKVKTGTKRKPPPEPKKGIKPLPDLPTGRYHTAEKIFKYWNTLGVEDYEKTVLYIYRKWPVIDRTKTGGPDAETNIGKYYIPFPLEDVVRIHGSGDYKIRLNDTAFARSTVMETHKDKPYRIRQEEYPPVLDLAELTSDPYNDSYKEQLRLKGTRIPGEEDKDMAAGNQAVETLTRSVENLTDKLITQSQRPPQITTVPVRDSDRANQNAQEMLVETCKTAIGIVRESASNNQKSSDPLEMVEAVTKIAERIAPKQDGSQMEMMRTMLEMQRESSDRFAKMQSEQIAELRHEQAEMRRTANPAAIPTAPKTIAEQLREMKDIKELMSDLSGNGGDEETGKGGKSGWLEAAVALTPLAGTLISGAVNIIHNLAVIKTGQGNPQSPHPQQQAPQQQVPGIAPPQEDLNMQNPLYSVYAQYHPFLAEVQKPLVEFLFDPNREHGGADFANLIIDLKGRPIYEQLKAVGPEMVQELLKSYPPVWGMIGVRPDKVAQFITDFMRFDEIMAEQEEVEPEVVEPVRRVKI